jgi:iron complex outermembrane recepter protein
MTSLTTPSDAIVKTRPLILALCLMSQALGASAANGNAGKPLEDLSLQDLMEMEVTSAAKKPQRLFDTDAAIHVITQDDMRRAGVTSIPEALRLAPGVNVARINGGLWAVSIRGFNGRFANKLLVLMDGRTLYTPLFAGVVWETQDTLLEDVERIEVIRGPGAALWGANAVNGVINIITKKAKDTQGNLVGVSAGDEERFSTSLRRGFKTSDDSHARIYAKFQDRDATQGIGGIGGRDDSREGMAGFRWDREGSSDNLSLQGRVYQGRLGDTQIVPNTAAFPYFSIDNLTERFSGAHLLGRWARWLGSDSEVSLQGFIDQARIDIPRIREERTTFDLEFQHRFPLAEAHDFTWGGGLRRSRDDIRNSPTLVMNPSDRALDLFNLFFQDEIALLPDALRLTLGARLEHNDFTGWEFQPNARLLWRINDNHSAWLAASRAVRTPSRAESDVTLDLATYAPFAPPSALLPTGNPTPFPLRLVLTGNSDYRVETLDALDLGYRAKLHSDLTLETTLFAYRYKDLIDAVPGLPDPTSIPAYVTQPLLGANNGSVRMHGLEVALDWLPSPGWRVQPAYSYARAKAANLLSDISLPRHQFSLRIGFEPTDRTQADIWLRRVDGIKTSVGASIPAYTTLDLRLGWRVNRELELSLVGQNLLDKSHPEFVSDYLNSVPSEIERSVFIKADWRF